MRTAGTKAVIVAYLALAKRAKGYPTPGREVGGGCHVSGVPTRRSLGMVTVLDMDGKDVTYEAWETLHGPHVPFTTHEWDTPRKHPTKPLLWDCEVLDPKDVVEPLTISERAELQTKHDNAKPAGKDWTPIPAAMEID